jgi:hypothetical protein
MQVSIMHRELSCFVRSSWYSTHDILFFCSPLPVAAGGVGDSGSSSSSRSGSGSDSGSKLVVKLVVILVWVVLVIWL